MHVGQTRPHKPVISLIAYGPETYRDLRSESWKEIAAGIGEEPVNWINVDGVHEAPVVEGVGKRFGMHLLQLEDVMNTQHRPTYRSLDGGGFMFILKMIALDFEHQKLNMEQLTVVAHPSGVLSFQERSGDVFDGLRERLQQGGGKTRTQGHEYLMYRLIDTVVDQYYTATDFLLEEAEKLEDEILESPDSDSITALQQLNKVLAQLRRSVSPLREAIGQLLKDPPELIANDTLHNWQDVHDHIIQIHDHLESLREIFLGLMDLHASGVNQRTNQIMQLMTMVATIFIPLTFIVGVYGMNFDHIPELHWKYGYAFLWTTVVVVAGGMFLYFRKKGWL